MTNLEKMGELKKELNRLDGIFNELVDNNKNERVVSLIIKQIR
jgi:hypothetical protein